MKLPLAIVAVCLLPLTHLYSAELLAGKAKIDITDRSAGDPHDPSYAKALVFKKDDVVAVLVTVDAVAIERIGRIKNDFLSNVRSHLMHELRIPPTSILVNASHCHGIVRSDCDQLVVQVVKEAWQNMVPVRVGAGVGHEDGISENRRLKMKDGSEVDMRRAYAMPRDEDVASVGPIDPQIGVLRIDRIDGRPWAIVYNFACHPIMNPPSVGSSADFPAYASRVIEESLGDGGMAFFVQGCAGDINPVRYKEVNRFPDAEPLGNRLGLSVMRAARQIETQGDAALAVANETIALPRGADLERRIQAIQEEQARLLKSLQPTNINFKTFLPLFIQQELFSNFPSSYSHSYLHDKQLGKENLAKLDAENRKNVEAYLQNVYTMEQLTRLNTNLALLHMHLAQNKAAEPMLNAEICGLRVGDFRLVTFPGELTVEIGLKLKKASQPNAFVAGYTNGYIYYTPTAEQRNNTGYAQEDCDSLVAAEWQNIFEAKALEHLERLSRLSADER